LLLAVVASTGCQHFGLDVAERGGKSPLKPPQMSPDSVVLEVFFVRFPLGDAEVNGRLWNEVDEMLLPAEVRQRLVRNGFRVGLVGGQVPAALSKLLELKDKPPPNPRAMETKLVDLDQKPRVMRRHIEVRSATHSEIIASDAQDEMVVLLCTPSGVEGETFHLALPVLTAKAYPEHDGRVRIKLVPEVQHGENRLRHVITPGMLRLESGKCKRVFEDMAVEAVLAPGHMLILSTLPDRSGSLGYRFFTQDGGGQLEQKLMVLRVAQTQHDELFDSTDILPLDSLTETASPAPTQSPRDLSTK
jgi:hypothetical protein